MDNSFPPAKTKYYMDVIIGGPHYSFNNLSKLQKHMLLKQCPGCSHEELKDFYNNHVQDTFLAVPLLMTLLVRRPEKDYYFPYFINEENVAGTINKIAEYDATVHVYSKHEIELVNKMVAIAKFKGKEIKRLSMQTILNQDNYEIVSDKSLEEVAALLSMETSEVIENPHYYVTQNEKWVERLEEYGKKRVEWLVKLAAND